MVGTRRNINIHHILLSFAFSVTIPIRMEQPATGQFEQGI